MFKGNADTDTLLKLTQQTCMTIRQCNASYIQKLQCEKTSI